MVAYVSPLGTLQSKCLFIVQGMNYEKLPLKVSFFRRVKSIENFEYSQTWQVSTQENSPVRLQLTRQSSIFLQHSVVSCPSAFSFMLCLSLCYALCLCKSIASLCYVATVDSTKSSWPAYR